MTTTVAAPELHSGGPPQQPQAPWRGRYDYCFWSHSNLSSGATYASQKSVYEALGEPLLVKAFAGYNTSLFAYGQTGSGKTYSMMGTTDDPGIIPRFSEGLFKRMDLFTRQNSSSQYVQYEVKVSCYEIYNEKIYDLLRPNIPGERSPALRVREHTSTGPYVEGIIVWDVLSQEDIQVYIAIANKNRATAASSMNDRSSRSHSVFTIFLHQSKTENLDDLGEAISVKTSNINLIDLAGSERADSAASDASGERLKEGASINKSLSTLGHVISALSKRESFVPYRNSVLTWLLKESLGGNAQTAMLFTISPSAAHLETTMSTLRYASTTRNIVNVATVNEDPRGRIISELREEVRHCRNAVQVLRERLARAGLPFDDVKTTPPNHPR
jgi:kinesin family protein 14